MIEDEYGMMPILKKHNAEGALKELSELFDMFCSRYMANEEQVRDSAFTEVKCFLLKALIDSRRDDEKLFAIIEGYLENLNGQGS